MNTTVLPLLLAFSSALAFGGVLAADSSSLQVGKVTRLMTKDLPDLSGKEGMVEIVDFAPGEVSQPHRHNADLFVYVLEGSVITQVKGSSPQTRDVLDLWQAGAIDAVSVYVAKAGSMENAMNVVRTAALLGLRCDINGSLETGVGDAASLHVALAAETLTLPSIIPIPSTAEKHLTKYAGRYWEDDVVSGGFSYKAGNLGISDAPGLGIEVDEKKVAKYTVEKPRRSRAKSGRARQARPPNPVES